MKAYQFKITIKDTHPPIWRRVIVPAGISFNQLTLVLNTAMGWCGYHLSSYTFQSLHAEFEDEPEDDFSPWNANDIFDAAEYIIDEYVESVKTFTYVYDFGDYWNHQVQVEKIIQDYENDYPKVIKFKGGCPKEDCGGVWGYEELIRILNDPDDPEYENMMEWSGGQAEKDFDMEFVNESLEQMKLTGKTAAPMSKEAIYDDFYAGKPFKTIKAKKRSVKDSVIQFPGRDSKSFENEFAGEEDYDEEDLAEEDYDEEVQLMIDAAVDMTMLDVIHMLKKNTSMSEARIKKILELNDEYYSFLMELDEIRGSESDFPE